MKKTKLFTVGLLIITISIFVVISYTSCKKDPCSGVICYNGATCYSGVCQCLAGYSGKYCEMPYDSSFVGSYVDSLQVNWVELRSDVGYRRFAKVLENLKIPYTNYTGNIDSDLENIFREIFK